MMSRILRVIAISSVASTGLFMAIGCGPEDVPIRDGGRDVVRMDASDAPAIVDVASEGSSCASDSDCTDGVYCNGEERCLGGRCQTASARCDDRHSCTTDTCDEAMHTCAHMPDHSMCGDMNACNGIERCDPAAAGANATTGCTPIDPMGVVDCDDANTCTVDNCDARVGCVHSPRDLDGDGHVDRACTVDGTPGGMAGDDCNDGDATTYPGAVEVCDDNRDNNCNGSVDYAEATCLPRNDTCANATRLPGPGTYWGSTTGLRDDYALGCNVGAFADAVFEFSTTSSQDVTISTSSVAANAGVALLPDGDCSMVTAIRCARGTGSVAPSLRVRSLPAGRYRIIAESGSVLAAFRLTLRFDPPTMAPIEDICPRVEPAPAIELNDGVPHMATLGMLENDYVLSCNPSGTGGRDAVFRLTVTALSDVTIAATAPLGVTYVSFRSSPCTNDASERRCFTGSGGVPPTLTQRGLAPGVYWVIVENSSDSTLNVQAMISPAAPRMNGDTCPGAIVMPNGPTVVVPSASMLRGSDVGTACGTSTTTGANFTDAVFQFTLTVPRDVVLTARVPTTTATVYMQVMTTCGARGTALGACVTGAPATRRLAGLAAGTYYVVVEASTGTISPIPDLQLQVTATDPAARPPVEACGGQTLRTDGTIFTVSWGTTGAAGALAAGPDVGTSCASRGTSLSYRDAVLSYTLASPMDVEITIDPLGSLIYRDVRTTCNDFLSSIAAFPCTNQSTPRTTRIRSQAAGTYFIVMETSLATPQPTSVRVTASPPSPIVTYMVTTAPAGVAYVDVCGMPIAGRVLPSGGYGATAPVPTAPTLLPFPMRVYGLSVAGPLTVSTAGWMSFNAGSTGGVTGAIPATVDPNLTVAPYWQYMRGGPMGICSLAAGTAPNRRFIIEWRDLVELGSVGPNATFEVIIHEAPAGQNNIIDVVYQRMDSLVRPSMTAGIENEAGTAGTLIPGPFAAPRIVRLLPMPM